MVPDHLLHEADIVVGIAVGRDLDGFLGAQLADRLAWRTRLNNRRVLSQCCSPGRQAGRQGHYR